MNFMDVDELVEYILSGEYLYRKPRELSFKQRLAKFVSYIKSFVKTRNVDDLYAAWRI